MPDESDEPHAMSDGRPQILAGPLVVAEQVAGFEREVSVDLYDYDCTRYGVNINKFSGHWVCY